MPKLTDKEIKDRMERLSKRLGQFEKKYGGAYQDKKDKPKVNQKNKAYLDPVSENLKPEHLRKRRLKQREVGPGNVNTRKLLERVD